MTDFNVLIHKISLILASLIFMSDLFHAKLS